MVSHVLGSHLFQRVASFLLVSVRKLGLYFTEEFSSLSESGFIPTYRGDKKSPLESSRFSSLSESGFIPTKYSIKLVKRAFYGVLISFREWLHSYHGN